MRAAGVLGGGNDVAAERLGLAERKFANDVNHQAAVERAKAEDQRIARENLAIRQFMEPIRAQEAAANFARKMLDMKNELNGRHQLVNFNLALDELDPRDHDYETQVAQLRLSPQFSDIPHVKGADLAIEKYVAMTAKSRDVYAPLRKAGIDLEQFTLRGPRGEFMEFKLREAQKAVLTNALDDAKTIGGGRVGVGSQGVTIYPLTPEKPVDLAKEASEKAKKKRWIGKQQLETNESRIREWYIAKDKLKDPASIRHAEEQIKKLQDDSDRILKSHEQEDAPAPPPPTEQKKPAGTPVNPAPAPATGAGTSPVPAETPTAPASKPPVKSARDAVYGRPATPPASQPRASTSSYGDPIAEIKRFTGSRADVESDPAMAAEFDSASESARSMLGSLGYDDESIDNGLQSVLDGQTLYVADGEAGTEDDEGTRAPLKKPAATVASVDVTSAAS